MLREEDREDGRMIERKRERERITGGDLENICERNILRN